MSAARWWADADTLQQEYEQHGTLEAVALHRGAPSAKTLYVWWKRHGLPPLPRGMKPYSVTPVVQTGDDDGWLVHALSKLGDEATVEQLADFADVAPRKVREAAERLGVAGYRIQATTIGVRLDRVPPSSENLSTLTPALFDGDRVRVGVVSDTHLGSNEEALQELHLAYEMFRREGIVEVWHSGDLGCGIEVFGRKQHSESHVHTLDEQAAHVVKNYPSVAGITTRVIGGNHDLEGAAGKAGWDLCRAVANERPDIDYLGPYEAWLETRPDTGRWIHLLHAKGGMSYAYSYKAQKLVDSYPSARKPAALIVGHWHVRGNIRARDVEVLWPGCFEWQSSFLARLGLQPTVGFHILTFTVADDGSIIRWMPEWWPYYPGRVA